MPNMGSCCSNHDSSTSPPSLAQGKQVVYIAQLRSEYHGWNVIRSINEDTSQVECKWELQQQFNLENTLPPRSRQSPKVKAFQMQHQRWVHLSSTKPRPRYSICSRWFSLFMQSKHQKGKFRAAPEWIKAPPTLFWPDMHKERLCSQLKRNSGKGVGQFHIHQI